jgi:bifunctional ADP-heptose synthase (sugar kinase/adenylyltransferase)
MFDFDKLLAGLADQHVLCVGDLMLDEFVYGEVARNSPEAYAAVSWACAARTMPAARSPRRCRRSR